jgi:hypothetical protein
MSQQFLKLFSDSAPALRVKFSVSDEEAKTIRVQHKLGSKADAASCEYLDLLGEYIKLKEFCEFYHEHDGVELCKTFNACYNKDHPLLDFKSGKSIAKFTSRYMSTGDRCWTIDLNKSKALYRDSAQWIAFAEIDSGPSCLTIFLDGDNAGSIYYVTPQPEFNILRPIAKDFQALLKRIGKDLPGFLRLVRATVSIRGSDGQNYGFMPVNYLTNTNEN